MQASTRHGWRRPLSMVIDSNNSCRVTSLERNIFVRSICSFEASRRLGHSSTLAVRRCPWIPARAPVCLPFINNSICRSLGITDYFLGGAVRGITNKRNGGKPNRPKRTKKKPSPKKDKQPRQKMMKAPTIKALKHKGDSSMVPPAQLLPTASPNVYIASCAVLELNVDPMSLFSDVDPENPSMPSTFRSAQFDYVSPKLFNYELPAGKIPEVAFIGRSNVGKSSLINAVMGRELARCSKTPGRTQQVNYFSLVEKNKYARLGGKNPDFSPTDATGFCVDLPGYGYANAPDANIEEWQKTTQAFFLDRRDSGTMRNVFVLIDARRGPLQFDRTIMGWFDEANIPYSIVITKADRVSKPQLVRFANDICMRYHCQMYSGTEMGTQGPIVHITSAKTTAGIAELRSSIDVDFMSSNKDFEGADVDFLSSNEDFEDAEDEDAEFLSSNKDFEGADADCPSPNEDFEDAEYEELK